LGYRRSVPFFPSLDRVHDGSAKNCHHETLCLIHILTMVLSRLLLDLFVSWSCRVPSEFSDNHLSFSSSLSVRSFHSSANLFKLRSTYCRVSLSIFICYFIIGKIGVALYYNKTANGYNDRSRNDLKKSVRKFRNNILPGCFHR
jgi:hypothetical protein